MAFKNLYLALKPYHLASKQKEKEQYFSEHLATDLSVCLIIVS